MAFDKRAHDRKPEVKARESKRKYEAYWRDPEAARARAREYHRRYRKTQSGQESVRRWQEHGRTQYPERLHARRLLEVEIRAGRIVRPDRCEHCNETPPLEADGCSAIQGHHHDYSKPLGVEWICRRCHAGSHRTEAGS